MYQRPTVVTAHFATRLFAIAGGASNSNHTPVRVGNIYQIILSEIAIDSSHTNRENAHRLRTGHRFYGTGIDCNHPFGKISAMGQPALQCRSA